MVAEMVSFQKNSSKVINLCCVVAGSITNGFVSYGQ